MESSAHAFLYDVLVDELVGLGTRVFFGLPGEDTIYLTTMLGRAGVQYINARHEAVAVQMADGYASATDGLGIVMVTRGPGLVNALTSGRMSAMGGRRVLIITCDAATGGKRAFDYKYVDARLAATSVGLEFFTGGDPIAVMKAFREAVACAQSGRATVVAIPVDLLNGPVESLRLSPIAAAMSPDAHRLEPHPADIEELRDLLNGSHRPLVIAGRGASSKEVRRLLIELAERTGALLGTTLLANGAFHGHPYNLGVVGGFATDPAAGLLAEVDCVLAFGASLAPRTTGEQTLFQGIPVIQVDLDKSKLGQEFPVRLGIHADATATAERLLAELPLVKGGDKPFHQPETTQRLNQPFFQGRDESTGDELDPRIVVTTLDRLLPEDRTVILDSGRFMAWPGRYMRVSQPSAFRLSVESGAIGMGLGVALGVSVAQRETLTVLFTGDGGLSMVLGDLETAVAVGGPLLIVVMNDRSYGAERERIQEVGLPADYTDLADIDFAAVARTLGMEAATVRTVGDLRSHAPRLAALSAPLLLDCRIRRDLAEYRARA